MSATRTTVRVIGAVGAEALAAHIDRAIQLPQGHRLQDVQFDYANGQVTGATIVSEQTVTVISAAESDAAWAERRDAS